MIVNSIALQPTREGQTTAGEGHVSGVRRRTDDDDVDAEQEQQRHVRAPAVHEPAELLAPGRQALRALLLDQGQRRVQHLRTLAVSASRGQHSARRRGSGERRAERGGPRTLLPRLPRKFQEISTLSSSGADTVAAAARSCGVFPWPGTGAEDTRA